MKEEHGFNGCYGFTQIFIYSVMAKKEIRVYVSHP